MKHWHYSAKVYERGSMSLINISSGVITTPNSMDATETIRYLSQMVSDQQQRKEVEISFDAFSLVETDDTEPSAPLTDEDIAQHRHDDKAEAYRFATSALAGMSHKDLTEHMDGIMDRINIQPDSAG